MLSRRLNKAAFDEAILGNMIELPLYVAAFHEQSEGNAGTVVANTSVLQPVAFDHLYTEASSVLFRISVVVPFEAHGSGETRSFPVYLQLLPDKVSQLFRFSYDKSNDDDNAEIVAARGKLGSQRIICVQFVLQGLGDLIIPNGFKLDESDEAGVCKMRWITSLASSMRFSVYMDKDTLSKKLFFKYRTEVDKAQSGLDKKTSDNLHRNADLSRLYRGRGGVVVEHACTSPIAVEIPPPHYSQLPACQLSPASCASTVAVDTPPEYRQLSPQQQVSPLHKRARSSSNDANWRHGKKVFQSPSAAATTTRFPDEKLTTVIGGDLLRFLARIESLEHEMLASQKGIAELIAENARQHQEIKDIRAENLQQQQQVEDLRMQNAQQEQQVERLRAQNAQQQQQINDLSKNSGFTHGVPDDTYVKLEIQRVREDIDAGQEALEALEERVERVEDKVDVLDMNLARAAYDVEELNDRIAIAESKPNEIFGPQEIVDTIVARLTQ